MVFSTELSQNEVSSLTILVEQYTDPSYWLEQNHTENLSFITKSITSPIPEIMQSIIISPYSTDNIILNDMTTIVRYTCDNIPAFSNWDSNVNPINFSLELYNYTDNFSIKTIYANIDSDVEIWKNMATAGSNYCPDIFKTVEINNLYNICPSNNGIWLFKGAISNSNLSATLNCLQKKYYQIITPAL
jgi:hypothetical protein